ncbi:TonB-linked SusC/RagA family outer membrane protein [Arcticibacter tournemirensis]|uniref:SusC/RagA family TonB-linked outer membrane protein n=1 Tax=Arcticibacter tournemirensis TaxID=699437 RepID=A0A5M9GM90_9SPHI|nr:SusC/RagA family TonB-linked outer membrane protein [Arcticibacter tournemirensis]KAA8475686.1 SusC/RagA family TonB-linked outer membrane protein [Arcticibacter tournemirensis]TQM50771.1 TonB-linked SusC/RagA family outer membrane protein [Arcticibacter tournemirensis]
MKHALFIFLLFSFPGAMLAQSQLTGRVLSTKDRSPLTGATIRVKNSKAGTSTGRDGSFSLTLPSSKADLIISYVGFEPLELSVTLPLKSPLEIFLRESAAGLQEVMVSTGYQSLPRERSTGSFSQVDNRRFNQQVSTDVISRLEAVAGGLSVGRTNNSGLMVRGLSTIQGVKGPLIVLDNFPYEGNIDNINPNDVENITILKDAAAASIWGSRAGNGVIVITTKKGRLNQPLAIELNSNVTVSGKPDLSYLRPMSSSDFIDVERMLYEKGYYNDKFASARKPAVSPVVELLDQADKTITQEEADALIDEWRKLDVRDDYDRYLYRLTVNQQYSLSMHGGSDAMAWNLSGGYDRNISNLDAANNRLNLNFNQSLQLTSNLQLSSGIYYTKTENESGRPGYGEIYSVSSYLYPYARLADEGGNALAVPRGYRSSYTDTAGQGKLLNWQYYPLEDYKHSGTKSDLQDVLLNFGLNYRLLKGLNADLKYQYEQQQSSARRLYDENSYFARDLVNAFTQLSSTGALIHPVPPGGVLDLSESLLKSNSLRGQLNYNRSFGKHAVAALAGGELRSLRTTGNAERSYGYNPDLLTFGNVDYTRTYPSIVDGTESFIPNADSFDHLLNRFVSLYGNAAYTYDGKYTVSGSTRKDASNLFGVNTNDRWNPLWSAGLSWDVSRESFYRFPLLRYLKLRATYGFSGNVNNALAAVTTVQYFGTNPYLFTPYTLFSNYANPELKWETSRMLNLGADFQLKDNRLSGSIEYYRKKGTDLFGRALIDYTSGIGSYITKNVASMKGKGLDIELNSINTTGALEWSTNLNFSSYSDEVTDFYVFSRQGSNFVGSSSRIAGIVGKPVYSVFSYRWGGLDPQTGDPQGYVNGELSKDYSALNGSGTTVDDLVYHGPSMPRFYGSLGNTFSYRNFSLTARLLYKFGYYFVRGSLSYSDLYSNGNGHADYALRWQKPGDEQVTDVPSQVYPAAANRDQFYAGSEVLVEKGDHIRLQYVSLSYDIKKQNVRSLPFRSLRLFMNVNNAGILWRANKQHLDPEYAAFRNTLPPSLSFALGLRATVK